MWHEDFGFDNDPYDIRNYSEKVIGEEAQEKQMIKWISSQRAVLLYGPTGVGKTTLVRNLMEKIESNQINELKGYKCIYYSCDRNNLKHYNWDLRRKKGLFGVSKKPIVAFVDEANFGEEKDLISISASWDNKEVFSVVFVQINENPKLDQLVRRIGIFKIRMRIISKNEIVELLRQRTKGTDVFSEESLQYIAGKSNLNPSIALQYCSQIATELAKQDRLISLKQAKDFDIKAINLESKEAGIEQEYKKSKDPVEKLRISPLKKRIVNLLKINSITIKELSDSCNASVNTISKQLSELSKENMVIVVDSKKPKRYGLEKKFERTILSD